MQGELLERGIGWYLQFEEIIQEAEDIDGPFWTGNINPGHVIGFSLGAMYVAWPLDFIPDYLPVVGFIDDKMILSGGTALGGWLWDRFD